MIKEGSVVTMTYVLTSDEGETLDQADKAEPFTYLHGYGQIVAGLEDAVTGLKAGAKKKVTVSPDEGYGIHDPELKKVVTKNMFPEDAKLAVGMQFVVNMGEDQDIVFTVMDIDGDNVSIDGNHPLAGETLHFDIEVVSVRDATKDEIAHGHAHGAHGHSHDH
jgi:FKBP-type peptidyl-prolyl cis-trans isomerase SlyD